MENIEILLKAYQKAEKNGWLGLLSPNVSTILATYPLVIFSHPFAKAFFGKNYILHPTETVGCSELVYHHDLDCFKNVKQHKKISSWQFHLQQMVVEPEPIKYLEKFL